jgi:hypothetical protein
MARNAASPLQSCAPTEAQLSLTTRLGLARNFRNRYVKPGAAGWRYGLHAPVHLVVYYRYYLFRPEGTFAYKTSPNPVRQVAREIALVRKTKNKQNIFCGQWELADGPSSLPPSSCILGPGSSMNVEREGRWTTSVGRSRGTLTVARL